MKKYLICLIIIVSSFSCVEKQPTQVDGQFRYHVNIMDASGIFDPDTIALSNALVVLESRSYFDDFYVPKIYSAYSQPDGSVSFPDLPSSKYTLSALKDTFLIDPQTGDEVNVRLNGSREVDIISSDLYDEALYARSSVQSNIVINEIYYGGPVNNLYYCYDQFVELYNPTNSTAYLDGLILCRARQDQHLEMETNDFVQVIYVYQFPGELKTGREYPIEPGQFIVVASDGYDHSSIVGTSIDLSQADWEFFNPIGRDIDFPPPNIENILPDHTTNFLINLVHNAVVLADGSDWYYGEERSSGNGQYVHIPISTVLDVVEYSSSAEMQKEITVRLDAGFAGIGMQKYSGKSVQRRHPGSDTNNSNLDFIIINKPTPGYQD